MSTKKTTPTNDSEVIEMLTAVLTYLRGNSQNKKKKSTHKKQASKSPRETAASKDNNLWPTDVIALYASEGKEALIKHLNSLDIPALKRVISVYGLDKSRASKDWKNKERFVSLIVDRVISFINKGESFKA